jgi:thiosulfate/3-mercaptopyruvate sulfurtransferase
MTINILISADELAEARKTTSMVIIDTRDPSEYNLGHIPGAINVRDIFSYLPTSTSEGINEMQQKFASIFGSAGLSGKEVAVIYEDAMQTGFGQSCRGYVLLKYLGYEKVAILDGGFKSWVAAGLDVSIDIPNLEPVIFPINDTYEDILISKNQLLKMLDDPSVKLLDVRDVDEWIGASSSPYGVDFCPRKGRIPGAVWIEWYRMMKQPINGCKFKLPNEILAECRTVGINKDSIVIIYCFKGARAANTFVALKLAGIKHIKIYFGSWNEWSQDYSLPIEECFVAS